MTRLLNPSPGEIFDRLSILELKINAAEKKRLDASNFQAEKAMLEDALLTWTGWLKEDNVDEETRDKIAQHRNGLAAVNALLWDAEDQVRELPEEEMSKLAQLAKRICKLNDRRAELVRGLGILYGAGNQQEKIYK